MRLLALIPMLFFSQATSTVAANPPAEAMVMTFAEIVDTVGNNVEFFGSGVLIDLQGHILTTASALGLSPASQDVKVRVSLNNSQDGRVTAQVVACSPREIDVCLIKVAASQVERAGIHAAISPTCDFIAQGSAVELYGYPNSRIRELARDTGDITTDLGASLKYRASARVAPGMGGGPVFVGGELVGLATGIELSSDLTVIQPLVYARDLIEMTGAECGALSDGIRSGLAAESESTGRLYDGAAFPQGDEHFRGFRNFVGQCAAGSYVDGVKLYSTTHEACNGCLVAAELMCRPLLK